MRRGLFLLLGIVLLLGACQKHVSYAPTPTPDYDALETAVAYKLAATLTAKAPAPTITPTLPEPSTTPAASPTASRPPTATPQPTFANPERLVALARAGENQETNILLYDTVENKTQVLTHFAEPFNMSDVTWSKDGAWLVFVSSHDFMHSRDNERNVFMMRPDGTELNMITGDYVAPETAPGPYARLSGQVIGAQGTCYVCAQGAPGVAQADENGRFELVGVPVSAAWARATCQQDGSLLEGDIDLVAEGESFAPIEIQVSAAGRGWKQASLSADSQRLGGVMYSWSVDEEGVTQTEFEGKIINLADQSKRTLEAVEGMRLDSIDWSPSENKLVGGLVGQDSVRLGLWDAAGSYLETLLDLHNPEDDILSIANPAWSPDGSQIAFELQHRYWWEGNRYRTDLRLVSADGDQVVTLIENEWGTDARDPSWTADGQRLVYQVASSKIDEDTPRQELGEIRSLRIDEPTPTIWISGEDSYLPAARPVRTPTPTASTPL